MTKIFEKVSSPVKFLHNRYSGKPAKPSRNDCIKSNASACGKIKYKGITSNTITEK